MQTIEIFIAKIIGNYDMNEWYHEETICSNSFFDKKTAVAWVKAQAEIYKRAFECYKDLTVKYSKKDDIFGSQLDIEKISSDFKNKTGLDPAIFQDINGISYDLISYEIGKENSEKDILIDINPSL